MSFNMGLCFDRNYTHIGQIENEVWGFVECNKSEIIQSFVFSLYTLIAVFIRKESQEITFVEGKNNMMTDTLIADGIINQGWTNWLVQQLLIWTIFMISQIIRLWFY